MTVRLAVGGRAADAREGGSTHRASAALEFVTERGQLVEGIEFAQLVELVDRALTNGELVLIEAPGRRFAFNPRHVLSIRPIGD